jgi:hypothetical protein
MSRAKRQISQSIDAKIATRTTMIMLLGTIASRSYCGDSEKEKKREKGRLMKLIEWPLRHAPVVLLLVSCV